MMDGADIHLTWKMTEPGEEEEGAVSPLPPAVRAADSPARRQGKRSAPWETRSERGRG